jgi:hypothetical protein
MFNNQSRVRVAPSEKSIQKVKDATENLKSMQPVLPLPKKESTREEWLERQHKILSYQPSRPVSFRGRQRGE